MPILRARIEQVRDVSCRRPSHTGSPPGHRLPAGDRPTRHGPYCPRHLTGRGGARVAARAILVATGSRPTHHPGIPFDDPDVYDSDEIYSIRTVPKDIVIVGGGPVGVEFATVFTALGIPATLVSRSDRLLPSHRR